MLYWQFMIIDPQLFHTQDLGRIKIFRAVLPGKQIKVTQFISFFQLKYFPSPEVGIHQKESNNATNNYPRCCQPKCQLHQIKKFGYFNKTDQQQLPIRIKQIMHGIRLKKTIHIPHVPQDRTSGSCQIYLKSPKYNKIRQQT